MGITVFLERDQINEVIELCRAYLEPCWRRLHEDQQGPSRNFHLGNRAWPVPEVTASGTCRFTSAFIAKQLKSVGVEAVLPRVGRMRVADPLPEDVLAAHPELLHTDRSDIWLEHTWLEHNGFVLDATKDQFGWDVTDILEVIHSDDLYERDPARSKMKWLASVGTTVSKFEGVTQSFWQDGDPYFAETRKRYASFRQDLSELLQSPEAGLAM